MIVTSKRIMRNKTLNHAGYGVYISRKHRRLRERNITLPASLAWIVTKILALSQYSTRVGAFTQCMNNHNILGGHTANMEQIIQLRYPSYLNYRDIDSEPSLESTFQKCHKEIFRISAASRGKISVVRSQKNNEHNFSSQKDDQNIVDEYLESISRRYERIHQNESNNDTSHKGFTSALAWLTANGVNEQNEDALFVLDLAGLASERLLQKHKLPPKNLEKQHFITSEVSILPQDQKIHGTRSAAHFRSKMSVILSKLRKRANLIFSRLVAILSLASECMGGGKLSFQFAILIACTVVMTRKWN